MSHGHAKWGQWSPTYKSWRYMRDRVARDPDYAGVTICERWGKFENFLADMGEQPNGKTLDRIDNGKGYAPENCQWATAVEQARNRTNNKHLTFGAVTRTVAEWATHVGLSLCPSCGSNYTHHGRVHVFSREREDSTRGYHVVAGDAGVAVDNNAAAGNPSDRRDGVVVEFLCENCNVLFEIHLAQHKGQSLMAIVPTRNLSEEDFDPD